MKLYKLTNKRMKTLDSFPYELGVEAKANSTKPAKLCTSGVLHDDDGFRLYDCVN